MVNDETSKCYGNYTRKFAAWLREDDRWKNVATVDAEGRVEFKLGTHGLKGKHLQLFLTQLKDTKRPNLKASHSVQRKDKDSVAHWFDTRSYKKPADWELCTKGLIKSARRRTQKEKDEGKRL